MDQLLVPFCLLGLHYTHTCTVPVLNVIFQIAPIAVQTVMSHVFIRIQSQPGQEWLQGRRQLLPAYKSQVKIRQTVDSDLTGKMGGASEPGFSIDTVEAVAVAPVHGAGQPTWLPFSSSDPALWSAQFGPPAWRGLLPSDATLFFLLSRCLHSAKWARLKKLPFLFAQNTTTLACRVCIWVK